MPQRLCDACTEEVHYFASDEACAAQDDYFHILIFGFRCFVFQGDFRP